MHLRLLFQKNLPMKIFKKNQKIYAKTKEVFGNPLMGYAPCAWNESVREDVTLLYMDITWAELEPVEGKFAWNAIDAENQVARWQAEGKHMVLRFVCDIPGNSRHMEFPGGCMRKQGTQESGMILLLERGFHRIIVTNSFWLLIKRQ
mgnify:CR=1 FL=1